MMHLQLTSLISTSTWRTTMFFVNAVGHLIKACNRSFFSLSLILFRSVDEVVPFNVERMKYCRNHWKNKWKNTGVLTKVYLLTYNE